jgi:hypothetical protein
VTSNIQDDDNNNPSRSINILNNRFANAAGFGTLNAPDNLKDGQCVNVSRSFVNVNNNYVAVTTPIGKFFDPRTRFIVVHNNTTGGVSAEGNSFQEEILGLTFGIMQRIIVKTDDSIDCSGHKLLFINQEASEENPFPNPNVSIINSSINAGEYLTIRADQGDVTFYNTDNIFFKTSNSNNSFTIKNGEIVTFVKIDNTIIKIQIPPLPDIIYYCTYQLVSVMRDIN